MDFFSKNEESHKALLLALTDCFRMGIILHEEISISEQLSKLSMRDNSINSMARIYLGNYFRFVLDRGKDCQSFARTIRCIESNIDRNHHLFKDTRIFSEVLFNETEQLGSEVVSSHTRIRATRDKWVAHFEKPSDEFARASKLDIELSIDFLESCIKYMERLLLDQSFFSSHHLVDREGYRTLARTDFMVRKIGRDFYPLVHKSFLERCLSGRHAHLKTRDAYDCSIKHIRRLSKLIAMWKRRQP
ncbi:MAG: hypothetical protein R2688_07330 [Fimbriimonadaceae bacterium]